MGRVRDRPRTHPVTRPAGRRKRTLPLVPRAGAGVRPSPQKPESVDDSRLGTRCFRRRRRATRRDRCRTGATPAVSRSARLTDSSQDHHSTVVSVIAQAIAAREAEIEHLQAELKALNDVEQLLGASAGPPARARRSSKVEDAAASTAENKPDAKLPRKRRPMSAAGRRRGRERMTAYRAKTKGDGRQEVGNCTSTARRPWHRRSHPRRPLTGSTQAVPGAMGPDDILATPGSATYAVHSSAPLPTPRGSRLSLCGSLDRSTDRARP